MRACLLAAVFAAVLCGTVVGSATLRGQVTDAPAKVDLSKGRVIVDGGLHVAAVDEHGQFAIPAQQAGSHILEFSVGDLFIAPVRVEVSETKHDRFRATVNDGSGRVIVNAMNDASYEEASASVGADFPVIVVSPIGEHKYFVPREGFNVMSMVKNPMVLMMLFSLGMVYVMPLIADQDEMKAQMKDMQKTLNTAQGAGGATAAAPQQRAALKK
jgi:hypothetical protein